MSGQFSGPFNAGDRAGSQPLRQPRPLPAKPRRVRDGVKLTVADTGFAAHPVSRDWIAFINTIVSPAVVTEGVEYARLGQTRRLVIEPGKAVAQIQGRAERAYSVSLAIPVLPAEQQAKIVRFLGEQARYAARILAGELPQDVRDGIESAHSIRLVPAANDSVNWSCTCAQSREMSAEGRACKHVACLAYLVGERLMLEPLLAFTLCGIPAQDLIERIRDVRASTAAGGRPVPVYRPGIPYVSDQTAPNIHECSDNFWSTDEELLALDYPIHNPEISHPLLRRLGTSPFAASSFPLIGFLATCYDTVTARVLASEDRASNQV